MQHVLLYLSDMISIRKHYVSIAWKEPSCKVWVH